MRWIRALTQPDADKPAEPPDTAAPAGSLRQLTLSASAAQKRGDWAEAHTLWQHVVAQEPRNAGAWLQVGNMRNELANHRPAIAAFRKAWALEPDNADATAGLAGVYERVPDWHEAAHYWDETIRLLVAGKLDAAARGRQLAHAFRHRALSALNAGNREQASEILLRGAETVPGFFAGKAHYRLRAEILRTSDPGQARVLLEEYIGDHSDDRGAVFDYASLSLADGEYEQGLTKLAPLLQQPGLHVDFLWLAADLNERLGRWPAGAALCERMIKAQPDSERFHKRLFDMQRHNRDLSGCRRTASAFAVRFASFDLVHGLISVYEENGETRDARLLCRWLMKAWPHSRWHEQHYMRLVASTISLTEADRLMRRYIDTHGRDAEIEVLYCECAARSGNHMEAKRRLEHYVALHPEDEDRQVLLGYSIANAEGLAAAEEHFSALAVRTYQAKSPLVGLAHMAMRRRDNFAAHERWGHVVGLYPDDTIARVEWARSAYELRRYDLAHRICEEQLRRLPTDVTMAEFHAWLLVATGRLPDARARIATLQKRTGPSWATMELAVQVGGQLGLLDDDAARLFDGMPTSNSFEDGKRFYHVVRQLWSARRPDLLAPALQHVSFRPRDVPWLWPYVEEAQGAKAGPHAPELRRHWAEHRALVRDDVVRAVSQADDETILQIVERPAWEQPVVHLVNKFEQVSGGSELHALDVAARLSRHAKVRLWAPEMPHPEFSHRFDVQAIEPGQGHVPQGGTLVLIGVYFDIATWIGWARPQRVIFLYNTFEAPLLFRRLAEVHENTGVRSELLYCSEMMGQEVKLPGFFEPSPIDIDLFRPAPEPPPAGRFVLGRHSRDVIEKHHPEDWRIYQAVAEAGGRSRLLGGTCMKDVFPPVPGIEYLPARTAGIAPFLQGLDCYLYRTSTWIEPWGRVVTEAMACGVPVIAGRIGGYAQIIEHDRNGLLFDTTQEAVEHVRALAGDPDRRRRLGQAGRETVEALLGQQALRRLVSFYLADAPA